MARLVDLERQVEVPVRRDDEDVLEVVQLAPLVRSFSMAEFHNQRIDLGLPQEESGSHLHVSSPRPQVRDPALSVLLGVHIRLIVLCRCNLQMLIEISWQHVPPLTIVQALQLEISKSLIIVRERHDRDTFNSSLPESLHKLCESKEFLVPKDEPITAIGVMEFTVKKTLGDCKIAKLGNVDAIMFVDSLHWSCAHCPLSSCTLNAR